MYLRGLTLVFALLACVINSSYSLPSDATIKDNDNSKASISNDTATRRHTSIADRNRYKAFAEFAYDAYCAIQVGEKVGQDGTLLSKEGNGINVAYTHISYSPTYGIVIAFEGTNSSSFSSITTNLGHHLDPPIPDLEWLGNVQMASSVQASWSYLSSHVQREVAKALKTYPKAEIQVTGHSLGAGIGLLSALSLSNDLKRSVGSVFFGMPRVGDQAFANAVDRLLPGQKHIINQRDPVPHLPASVFGFRHPSGEVYRQDEHGKDIFDCDGQENVHCAFGLHMFEFQDHLIANHGISDRKCPSNKIDKEVRTGKDAKTNSYAKMDDVQKEAKSLAQVLNRQNSSALL